MNIFILELTTNKTSLAKKLPLAKKKTIDIRDAIQLHLQLPDVDRSLRWLATKTNINYRSLHCCVVEKRYLLSEENLKKINAVLKTKFQNTQHK